MPANPWELLNEGQEDENVVPLPDARLARLAFLFLLLFFLAALEDMTKGKIVDASVEYTCDVIESNGGICTPALRAKLREIYKKGLDKVLGELAENHAQASHLRAAAQASTGGTAVAHRGDVDFHAAGSSGAIASTTTLPSGARP